jgi:hypothetical protein
MIRIPSSAFLNEYPDEFEIIQNENEYILSGSITRQIIKEGIFFNCLPSISNIVSPGISKYSSISILKNNVNKEISVYREKQENNIYQENIENKSVYFNESKIQYSNISLLNNLDIKKTKIITFLNTPYKEDEIFKNQYIPFDENIIIPNVLHLLNNLEESVLFPLVSYDDNIKKQYTKKFNYPINYNNSLDVSKENKNIEPFSLMSEIQFKSIKEYETNRLWSSINNSMNSRNENITYSNVKNINENYSVPYYENITKESYFVEKNTLQNFISTDSYVVLPNVLSTFTFYENDINFIYSSQNYHDLDFKNLFMNLKLYENIINREDNVSYKENDKFASCGFDYSYTNSLGKNSIAFKGLE